MIPFKCKNSKESGLANQKVLISSYCQLKGSTAKTLAP
jgi:hypothetical protein